MFGNLCKWFPILFVWNLSTLKKPANMISLYLKPKSMPTPQNPHSLLPLVFTLRKCHLSSNSTRPLHDETHIIHIYQYIDIYSRCSTFSNDARVSSGLPHGSRSHTPSCDFATQPNEASEFAVSSWLFTHLNISQQVQYSARSICVCCCFLVMLHRLLNFSLAFIACNLSIFLALTNRSTGGTHDEAQWNMMKHDEGW